jgi:hypothetical protein
MVTTEAIFYPRSISPIKLVAGSKPIAVLVRAVGPTLAQFGVTGVFPNPRLTLFRDANIIATNDDWGEVGPATIAGTGAAFGAFVLSSDSRDAAIVATVQPGSYTAQVSGVGGTGGGALVEVYEVP